MRVILFLLSLAASQFCFAGGDTNIIAMSDWSKPVSTIYGHTLRARMIIAQEHSPAHTGRWPETEFYLEIQNVSSAIGSPTRFYFDPWHGLHCVMWDANGNALPEGGGAGSGGGAGAGWITLPYDCTIRLRANMYGYGLKPGDGFLLTLCHGGDFGIRSGDTNAYYLSGTFNCSAPTNTIAGDFESERALWDGRLELPKMKIEVSKP